MLRIKVIIVTFISLSFFHFGYDSKVLPKNVIVINIKSS